MYASLGSGVVRMCDVVRVCDVLRGSGVVRMCDVLVVLTSKRQSNARMIARPATPLPPSLPPHLLPHGLPSPIPQLKPKDPSHSANMDEVREITWPR